MFKNEEIYVTKVSSVIYVNFNAKQTCRFPSKLLHYELIYKVSGHSIAHFGNTSYELLPGCIRFLPISSDTKYSVEILEPGDSIDIYFDTTCPMPKEALFLMPHDTREANKLKLLFFDAYNSWKNKRVGYHAHCMSIVYQIIEQLQNTSHPRYLPSSKYSRIKDAVEYMEAHAFDSSFDYKKLAEMSNMSYSYFKRLFVEKFGVPPQRYVRNLKMRYACDLLSTDMYSITQISEILGFESAFYFSHVFKEEYHISPSGYRNICLKDSSTIT